MRDCPRPSAFGPPASADARPLDRPGADAVFSRFEYTGIAAYTFHSS